MSVCFKCEDSGDNLVKCDGCKRNVCGKCSDLTQTELRCMALKTRKLKYLCDGSETGLFRVPEFIIENLRVEPRSNEEDLVSELQERHRREKNVIILNIPECSDSNPAMKKAADGNAVKELFQKMTGSDFNVVSAFRIGNQSNDPSGRVRPLKVLLSSRSDVVTILKNSKKSPGNVRVKSDLTPKQQEHLPKLYIELEARKAKGEDLMMKYIRGVPKIVAAEALKNQ